MSEEEDEVITTSPIRVSFFRSMTLSSQVGGKSLRLNIEN
jgi:hypothetical protein